MPHIYKFHNNAKFEVINIFTSQGSLSGQPVLTNLSHEKLSLIVNNEVNMQNEYINQL